MKLLYKGGAIIELIEDYFETYSDDISDCFTITY